MATRSGGGTGVIVALVVFVLTTICLLVVTIAFYSQKEDAISRAVTAERELNRFASQADRSGDRLREIEGAAASATPRRSVSIYLMDQLEEVNAFVSGNRSASLATHRNTLGLGPNDSVINAMGDLRRRLSARDADVTRLESDLAARGQQIADLNSQLAAKTAAAQQREATIRLAIESHDSAAQGYEEEFRRSLDLLDRVKAEVEDASRQRLLDEQRQNDALRQDNAVLQTRVTELQRVVDAIRIKPANPAELVDGRIIDVAGSDEVYIDLGRRNRVVLGMTFEVYDDAQSIQVDPRTGQETRGKASLQVINVGDTTSLARITRSSAGRPVVRGNVIANAVYDPTYRFRFLVHGRFDVNDDGRPTEAGAEFVRSRIIEWGGEVVQGDELTGDLDFLILGAQPPLPAPLSGAADAEAFDQYIQRRAARERYDELFRQAREAQIPVLNWNRFQVLTGMTDR